MEKFSLSGWKTYLVVVGIGILSWFIFYFLINKLDVKQRLPNKYFSLLANASPETITLKRRNLK